MSRRAGNPRYSGAEELTHHDRAELERFAVYCRLLGQAQAAGVPGDEAARSIYPDVYEREVTCPCEQCQGAKP